MGDVGRNTGSGPPQQQQQSQDTAHDNSRFLSSSGPSPGPSRSSSAGAPFYSQYSHLPAPHHQQQQHQQQQPQQKLDPSFSHQSGNPYVPVTSPSHHSTSFDMGAMAGALPPQPHQPSSQRITGASTPAVVYQLQQNLQYGAHGGGPYGNQGSFAGYSPQQYSGFSHAQNAQAPGYSQFASRQPPMAQVTQQYPQYPASPQYYYYPGAMGGPAQQVGTFPNQHGQFQGFQQRPTAANPQDYDPRSFQGYGGQSDVLSAGPSDEFQGSRRRPSEGSMSAIPRGPPRKPKQSGHALWVGNLPPGATVIDLKDHFSRDATRDIESLFLISKSNCAFVNYRSEAACAAAMQRFHDSRFHGVRLVCRLRRSSAAAAGVPTAPASMSGRRASMASSSKSPLLGGMEEEAVEETVVEEAAESNIGTLNKVEEKFFIVKSLTLQDLEQSVLNGIWATQAHNEEALNKAYQAAENVYLIFSANKSGEYFGYARMASQINADAAEIYRAIPEAEPVPSSDTPKTIRTNATEFAPRGRIIDDSARGTIFWEAELSGSDTGGEGHSGGEAPERADTDTSGAPQTWGKPFKVEWMSTNRLPFYRTRGLRNPWNANREVKIARDGTELETGVGKKLVQMFHRPGPSPAPPALGMAGPQTYQ